MTRTTTLEKALNWLKRGLVHCTTLGSIDESIYENAHIDDDGPQFDNVLYWLITDMTDDEVEWMEKSFKGCFFFTYSEKLECWCIGVCGPSYNLVDVIRDDINEKYL